MNMKFTDNSEEVLAAMQEAAVRALEKCGLTAEGYAKKLCPVDTGLLRNSITHALAGEKAAISSYKANKGDKEGEYSGTAPEDKKGELSVYIGSNVEYAAHQELGTGKHTGGGRPTSWVYEDAKGNMHKTGGDTAKPFLKPAVADHANTYRKIMKDELKGK